MGQFWGGGQRETRRMIHLDRRAISRINRMSLYPYLFYLYMTGHKKISLFFMACGMIAPSSHISAALNMRDFRWIRSFALTNLDLAKRTLSLRANKQSRSKTRKRSCRRSSSFPRQYTTVATMNKKAPSLTSSLLFPGRRRATTY